MKFLSSLMLAAMLFIAAPALADNEIVKHVFIGDQDIALPEVLGFKEILGTNPEFDKQVKQFVPPENRLLAVYLSFTDIKAMTDDPDAGFKRYILVQTPKTDLPINSPKDFDVIKSEIIHDAGSDLSSDKQTKELLNTASNYMSDYYHKSAKLQVGETKSLGAFINTENSIALAMLANIGMTTPDGIDKEYPLATGVIALTVKNKVLFANVYSNYTGAQDAEFVRDSAKDFVDYTLKANGNGSIATPGENSEVDFFLNLALKGTLLVMVIVLVGFAGPRIAKSFRNKDPSV